jgi:hypothetical protein
MRIVVQIVGERRLAQDAVKVLRIVPQVVDIAAMLLLNPGLAGRG